MNMKKLIESIDVAQEGLPNPMPSTAPEMDKGNPVTMNVSMNASGKEHVADLIDMMKNAGMEGAKEVDADIMPMRRDMERLRDIVKGPDMEKDMDDLKPGMQDEPCDNCGKQHVGASSCNDDIEMDDEAVADEAYANEPDEKYSAIDDVINSGDDLHKSKAAYPATQGGDNPMALQDEIKEKLAARLKELMAGDVEEAGDHDHEEGEEHDCPECGAPGKTKLMACSSCGCS
jgi:hypothetical protein